MAVVFAIGFHVFPPSMEDSHPFILENVPFIDNEPELEPVQTEVLEEIIPEEAASTVMIAGVE